MTQIIKIIDPKETEMSVQYGVMSFCSFERLIPYLGLSIGLRPSEKIVGIVVNENGINCKIETT